MRVFQGGKKAMNFGLTREQELVRQMVREFAVNEVKPIAAEIDETERFPMENVKKMAELGMMGIPFPKELGGAGGDVLSYIVAVEELSKVCGTTGVIVSAHTSLCASLIYENGTPAQKEKYLVPLAKGEKIGAFGLTEPGAASVPAPGSVRPKAPNFSPFASGTTYFFFCSSVPNVIIGSIQSDV